MISNPPKNKKRRNIFSLISVIFLIVFLFGATGFLITTNIRMNKRRAQLSGIIDSLKKEISVAEEKNTELKAQISQSLQSDFIEKEARERLNLQKPGESVIVVLPPKDNSAEQEKPKTFWQKIWEKIKF